MSTDDATPPVKVELVEDEAPKDKVPFTAISESLIDNAPVDRLGGMEILDGLDHCIVGVVDNFVGQTRLCYDSSKIIKTLVEEEGLSLIEAHQKLFSWTNNFNIDSPCFLEYGNPLTSGGGG